MPWRGPAGAALCSGGCLIIRPLLGPLALIERVAVAYEAGATGTGSPAGWMAKQGIEVHVIHASSVEVPREHKRANNGARVSDAGRI